MNALEESRLKIDELDAEFVQLFEKRFHIVKDIIDYKLENHLPILDSGREEEIIEKNTQLIEDEDLRLYFRKVYAHLIEISREYQDDVLKEK